MKNLLSLRQTAFLSAFLFPPPCRAFYLSAGTPHTSTMRPFLLKGHSRPLTQLK